MKLFNTFCLLVILVLVLASMPTSQGDGGGGYHNHNDECKNDKDCRSEGPCSQGVCDKKKGTCKQSYLSSSTVCRRADGVCDKAEYCTGDSSTCPQDKYQSKTTLCRASKTGSDGTSCDKVEFCSGNSKECPKDEYLAGGYVCRAANGDCDVAEKCTGYSPDCPRNQYKNSRTVCRPAQKAADWTTCDKEETCSGHGPDCPHDDYQPSGKECRGKKGVCDVAEKCTGSSARCPDNHYEPATTVCRPAVKGDDGSTCDKNEYCTGSSQDCPADLYLPVGTQCRAASYCDIPGVCNGSRVCPPNQKRDKGYFYKCGDKLYVCGMKKSELKEVRDDSHSLSSYELNYDTNANSARGDDNDKNRGKCQTGGVKEVVELPYPSCLSQCPRRCPNSNSDISYLAWARCSKEKGEWSCFHEDKHGGSGACPPWGTS